MSLNWARTARLHAKLSKQFWRRPPPLHKQTISRHRDWGGGGSGGRGGRAGRPSPWATDEPGVRACLASQRGGSRFRKRRPGRERSGLCGGNQGPQGDLSARKRWRNEWRAEERGRCERGKGAPQEGLQRGGGERRAVTKRKGKSDGGTSEGRRQGPGEEELEKSQGEGWEVTGMRTRGRRGGRKAPLPLPGPAALPP